MALVGVWVEYSCWGNEAVCESAHVVPDDGSACGLASAEQAASPCVDCETAESAEGDAVGRDGVIIEPATYDASQPGSLFLDGSFANAFERGFEVGHFCVHSFGDGVPVDCVLAVTSSGSCDVRESEEIEGFRAAFLASAAVRLRESSEFDQAGFVRVEFQSECV